MIGTLKTFASRACIACALNLAGCSQSGGCSASVPPPPQSFAQLSYPEPGATGVQDDVGLLLYANADANVPIELTTASATVTTIPTAVPSPLPSPIVAPPYGETLYARTFPTLAPDTTYHVQVYYSVQGGTCYGVAPKTYTGYTDVGSFTTK